MVSPEDVVQGLDLSMLGRQVWERGEALRDVELLEWIDRFRFVTPVAIAERFGVSWQRANARVRRLERVGLLGTARSHVSQPRAVFLTGRACELLDRPRRRPPRAEVQREHEAAIVWLCTRIERETPDARVLTERECRRLDREAPERFSVWVRTGRGTLEKQRRWPDLAVDRGGQLEAIEIEFAPKGTARLQAIIGAYSQRTPFGTARFYARSPALARRLQSIAARERVQMPQSLAHVLQPNEVIVAPWPGLTAAEQDTIRAAMLPKRPPR